MPAFKVYFSIQSVRSWLLYSTRISCLVQPFIQCVRIRGCKLSCLITSSSSSMWGKWEGGCRRKRENALTVKNDPFTCYTHTNAWVHNKTLFLKYYERHEEVYFRTIYHLPCSNHASLWLTLASRWGRRITIYLLRLPHPQDAYYYYYSNASFMCSSRRWSKKK